jgi:hypothetical protein
MTIAPVTLGSQPDKFSPVYNENWFQLQCASASVIPGFQYVYDIITRDQLTGATISNLGRFISPSRPVNFDGLFSPKNILSSQVGSNFQPSILATTKAEESILRYKVNYGFEINPGITFSDTQYQFGTYSGKLGLTFSYHHDLLVGDQITISMNNRQLNPQYNTTASVVFVNNPYEIVTNLSFGQGSSNEGGAITDLIRIVNDTNDKYTFNGTRQYNQRQTNFDDYVIGSQSIILTNYVWPRKSIFEDQNETLSLLVDNGSIPIDFTNIVCNVYGPTNSLLSTFNMGVSTDVKYKRIDMPSGTQNLQTISSSTDFVVGNRYDLLLLNASTTILATFSYQIVSDCSQYDNVRILWLNRLGGVDYFNFNKDKKKVVTTNKVEWKRQLPWNYSIGDKENSILSQEIIENFTLNSNWITENESTFLQELLTSPEVFIEDGNNLYPITITDQNYEVKTVLRNKLFNLTINYKNSYDVNIQNG